MNQHTATAFALAGMVLVACPALTLSVALSSDPLNPTQLPIGDGQISSQPRAGFICA